MTYGLYKQILEEGINTSLKLRILHNQMKKQHGERKAIILWDEYIQRFSSRDNSLGHSVP